MNKLVSFQRTFVHVQFSAVSTTVHGLAWTALSTLSITTVICIQQTPPYTDSYGLLCPSWPSTSTTVHGLEWTALSTLSITTIICIQQTQLYTDSHGLLCPLCPSRLSLWPSPAYKNGNLLQLKVPKCQRPFTSILHENNFDSQCYFTLCYEIRC